MRQFCFVTASGRVSCLEWLVAVYQVRKVLRNGHAKISTRRPGKNLLMYLAYNAKF